jgi:DNA-binding MarR family transcriptional regulator
MDKNNFFHHMDHNKQFEHLNEVMLENMKEISGTDDVSGFQLGSNIRMLANFYDSFLLQKDGEKCISGPRLGILIRLMMEEKYGISKPMTPTFLSRSQNVSKNTISSLIAGLEAQGLVTREIDPNDKRVFQLHITEKGRELVKEEAPQKAKFMNSLASELSIEEKKQLIELLQKLRKSVISQAHHGRINVSTGETEN